MTAVLVVREEEEEEEEADEFRPEPEPEEIKDAKLRGAVGPKTIRCGGVIPEGYRGGAGGRH